MVSVYGFYHGKSTCFTTIRKKMFETFSNHPGQANRSTWYVNQSTNLRGDSWNFLPYLGNETNEYLFITANQLSPPQTYPPEIRPY